MVLEKELEKIEVEVAVKLLKKQDKVEDDL